MKDEFEEGWLKYLRDFAYAQDGEYGDCSISDVDVFKRIQDFGRTQYLAGLEKSAVIADDAASEKVLYEDHTIGHAFVEDAIRWHKKDAWKQIASAIRQEIERVKNG